MKLDCVLESWPSMQTSGVRAGCLGREHTTPRVSTADLPYRWPVQSRQSTYNKNPQFDSFKVVILASWNNKIDPLYTLKWRITMCVTPECYRNPCKTLSYTGSLESIFCHLRGETQAKTPPLTTYCTTVTIRQSYRRYSSDVYSRTPRNSRGPPFLQWRGQENNPTLLED